MRRVGRQIGMVASVAMLAFNAALCSGCVGLWHSPALERQVSQRGSRALVGDRLINHDHAREKLPHARLRQGDSEAGILCTWEGGGQIGYVALEGGEIESRPRLGRYQLLTTTDPLVVWEMTARSDQAWTFRSYSWRDDSYGAALEVPRREERRFVGGVVLRGGETLVLALLRKDGTGYEYSAWSQDRGWRELARWPFDPERGGGLSFGDDAEVIAFSDDRIAVATAPWHWSVLDPVSGDTVSRFRGYGIVAFHRLGMLAVRRDFDTTVITAMDLPNDDLYAYRGCNGMYAIDSETLGLVWRQEPLTIYGPQDTRHYRVDMTDIGKPKWFATSVRLREAGSGTSLPPASRVFVLPDSAPEDPGDR